MMTDTDGMVCKTCRHAKGISPNSAGLISDYGIAKCLRYSAAEAPDVAPTDSCGEWSLSAGATAWLAKYGKIKVGS